MKAPKILLAGLLALSTAGIAQAQTVIHITGSTAFRSAVHTAITHILVPGFTYGYSGTSFGGANQAIFTGTANTNGGIPVIIKTSWSGSLAGIETVSQAYASTVGTFLTNTTPQSTTGSSNAPSNYDPPCQPEVCMNDGYQYDSSYPTPALTEITVGVVDFKFVKNHGAPSSITNITPLLAQALWKNGYLPLSMWSGNTSDSNTFVYATGRDPDSGTRKTAFLETGIQIFDSIPPTPAQVIQWEPTNSSGQVNKSNPTAITGQTYWPAETVDNIFFPLGDGGYSSGGDLAVAMEQSSSFIYITYLGLSDALTLETADGAAATDLSYNGVPFSHAAVQNGQYTYWAYEFLGYLPSYISTIPNAQTVANLLAGQIANESLTSVGENLPTMNVSRSQEGGIVTP
jgi:hypothetical protein